VDAQPSADDVRRPAAIADFEDDARWAIIRESRYSRPCSAALQRLKREGWQLDEPRPSVLDDALHACGAERRAGRRGRAVRRDGAGN